MLFDNPNPHIHAHTFIPGTHPVQTQPASVSLTHIVKKILVSLSQLLNIKKIHTNAMHIQTQKAYSNQSPPISTLEIIKKST